VGPIPEAEGDNSALEHGAASDGAMKAIVLDSLNSLDSPRSIETFCSDENIELVELSLDTETLEVMRDEYHEEYGISRLLEMLETTSWPKIQRKPDHLRMAEQRRRLEVLIKEAEDEENGWGLELGGINGEDQSADFCDLIKQCVSSVGSGRMRYPRPEDEAAILEIFDKPSHNLPDELLTAADGAASTSAGLAPNVLESLEEGTLQSGDNGERGARCKSSKETTNRQTEGRQRMHDGVDDLTEILNRNGISNSTFDPSTIDQACQEDWGRMMMEYLAGISTANVSRHSVTRSLASMIDEIEKKSNK